MGSKEYEKITPAVNLFKLLVSAEEDITVGRYEEAKEFFEQFKRDKKYGAMLLEI